MTISNHVLQSIVVNYSSGSFTSYRDLGPRVYNFDETHGEICSN